MARVTLMLAADPPPVKCGAGRGKRSRTRCELPPDHVVGRNHTPYLEVNHFGRDPAGRWQSWSPAQPVRMVKSGGVVLPSELDRDDVVRQVPCPVCGVQALERCWGEADSGRLWCMSISHTGRYLAAVDAGLVPPLQGWPWR